MHRPLLPLLLLSLVLQSCDRLGTLIPQGSRAYAEAITVRIGIPNQGEDGGSGVLVERQGNRYTVLTNCHVLGFGAGTYTLWVAGGDRYQISINDPKSHCHGSADLAKFTFETNKNYPVATVRERSLSELTEETSIQVAGYPNRDPNGNDRSLSFSFNDKGRFTLQKPNNPNGYHLIHNLETLTGMSGGPILDTQGRLLAINGETREEGVVSTFAAIPIRFYTNWDSTPIASNPVNNPVTPKPVSPPPPTPTPTPSFLGLPVQSFNYTSARVSSTGDISPYEATGKRYTETDPDLNLPAGAVPLEMVAIEGGTFTMGSPDTEVNRDSDEGPQHQVTVPDFFMGQYEVTQAQYEAVMGNNPAYFKGDNNPVENVSWDDAQEFIQRLNRMTGKTYRLPTEAEWEYAARAGTSTPFSYGDSITPKVVNYGGAIPYTGGIEDREYRQKTIAVNTLPPNPWGLYHIHGNVIEWCADQWYDSYNNKPDKLKQDGSIAWTQANTNILPSNAADYLLRGGSWGYDAWDSRSAYRYRWSNGSDLIGFRVLLSSRIP